EIGDVAKRLVRWRRDLVFHDLNASFVADDLFSPLDGADAADIKADRGVKLERVASRRRFRIAEHDADLHSYLVDENDQDIGALDVRGELAQRLAHQSGLQAGKLIAHLALDLG